MTRAFRSVLPIIAAAALACAAASSASADGVLGPLTTSLLGGSCGSTQAVFAPWGDPNQYYFTNNGGFESGSTGWTLSGGAQVVAGNESFDVHSTSDSHSLLIPAGGSATSPADCFGLTTPGIRFFAMSDSGPATIHVRVIASGLLGILSILDGGTATVGPTWQPTPVFSTTFSQLDIPVGTKSIRDPDHLDGERPDRRHLHRSLLQSLSPGESPADTGATARAAHRERARAGPGLTRRPRLGCPRE